MLSVLAHKKQQTNFYNSEWQSKQGKKGGRKGGAKKTHKQTQARKNVGLNYGFGLNSQKHKDSRQRGGLKNSLKQRLARSNLGKSKQTPQLKKFLSKTTIWMYEKNKDSIVIKVPPQSSVIEIIDFLTKKIPNLKQVKQQNFYNLVRGRTGKLRLYDYSNKKESLSLFFILL